MKLRWMLAAAVLTFGNGAAFAQLAVYEYIARTAAPATRSGDVAAGSLTWTCAQSECRISGPWPAPGVGACATLAGQVGRIVSYGRTGAMLNEAQLAQCNASIPSVAFTAQTARSPALLATSPVQAPTTAVAPAAPSQPRLTADGVSSLPIEDAVMLVLATIAEDAKDDLRSMLDEMDATRSQRNAQREQLARQRTQQAELRDSARVGALAQSQAPTALPVTPLDPCATSTIEAWRICAGQIEARLTSAPLSADDRRRLEPTLAALRAELDAITGDDAASRPHFDRSRQLAATIADDLEAITAR